MPFPFLPGGAILAIAVLGGALTIFGLALGLLDRATGRAVGVVRGSVLPGIVSGWQGWQGWQGRPVWQVSSPASGSPDPALAARSRAADVIEIVDLD